MPRAHLAAGYLQGAPVPGRQPGMSRSMIIIMISVRVTCDSARFFGARILNVWCCCPRTPTATPSEPLARPANFQEFKVNAKRKSCSGWTAGVLLLDVWTASSAGLALSLSLSAAAFFTLLQNSWLVCAEYALRSPTWHADGPASMRARRRSRRPRSAFRASKTSRTPAILCGVEYSSTSGS